MGVGSRPGERRGGRKKGTPNKKITVARVKAEIRAAIGIVPAGFTPLEYMERVMNDESQPEERRDKMAICAAPYRHPRLTTTSIGGDKDNPLKLNIEKMDSLELSRRLVFMMTLLKEELSDAPQKPSPAAPNVGGSDRIN